MGNNTSFMSTCSYKVLESPGAFHGRTIISTLEKPRAVHTDMLDVATNPAYLGNSSAAAARV